MRLAIPVIAVALTAAVGLPTLRSASVPISEVKLVAETSASPEVIGAAARNGQRNGRTRVGFAVGDLIARRFDAYGDIEALVAVELR